MQQPAALRRPKHPLTDSTPSATPSQATPTALKTATSSSVAPSAPSAPSSVAPSAIQAQKPIGVSNATQTAAKEGANGTTNGSRGQIHVKVLQARNLNIRPHPLATNPRAQPRPYVVVQFEQNEFISRDPIREHEREVKGVATALSRNASSTALEALGAINARAMEAANRRSKASNGKDGAGSGGSAGSSPSSTSSDKSARTLDSSAGGGGLFGRSTSPHNPVWKHEVSFDVTSDQSLITFNVYDRADEDQQVFLGSVEIRPVLKHDHTVDHWYRLLPHENENEETVVTGEMRIQTTYEQFKTKRTLTPKDFEFLKLIGRGTFGRVYQVRKRDTRRIYAMKVLSKKEIIAKKEIAHTIGERKILQTSLHSPFLVGLKFSFQTDTDLYLVTDFKSGGELFWHLQKDSKFPEERARFYIAELVLALEHLHKYDIVYRDLKPENILLDATGHIALCDFGLSKPDLKSDQLTNTFCGTTEYLAPEVLLDDHGYSKLVDFWSLGVLLFEMCCGWSPFYAEDTQKMYKNICFGKIRFPKNIISEDGKQFVKGLLNRNPRHRLGAQRDCEELKEHPFFRTIDWKALAAKQVTPPFIPVVESDESTAYFDPEFTSADVNEDDAVAGVFDDEDPSEDWVMSASFTSDAGLHMPNGPLGSDITPQRPQHAPIQINTRKGAGRGRAPQGSPISSSVQEKFRGFSFTGESFVHGVDGKLAEDKAGAEEVEVIDADDLDGEGDDWEDEEEENTSPTAVNGNGMAGGVGEKRNGVAPGSRKKGRKGGRSGVSSPLAADEYDEGRLGGKVATAKKWSDLDGYL
ncbi:kinase-like protein [Schizopora paradoxa]|uniref:Kinase-like protein n=1 Tax=Schizopora paradoxa TaxID=27342 RepID=A0A0H2RH88_9AGAM|nr:kinase-like protein [Schizopora paradoxa]